MEAAPATRNLAAECRAVEEGHRARLDNGAVVVTSDTHRGKEYRVTAASVWAGQPVSFACTPEGDGAFRDDHGRCAAEPGVTKCKHAALAARRLEREGLAELRDGLWVATHRAASLSAAARRPVPADPFEGLV